MVLKSCVWDFFNSLFFIFLFYIDSKVLVVHKREHRVSSNGRLVFENGTELPPFPESVDEVTFTWLATSKEEVCWVTK